jgi:hypothetical protein
MFRGVLAKSSREGCCLISNPPSTRKAAKHHFR